MTEKEKIGGLPLVPDFSAIAEQLCRIEHKLDLLVEYLACGDGAFPLRKMKDEQLDPITQEPVRYLMDLMKRHVVRVSSDGTGLLPPSNVLFSQPTPDINPGNQGSSNGESP